EFSFPSELNNENNKLLSNSPQSMEDAERMHIINSLKKSSKRINGAGGAAELLKLPPTTLTSKIKKLGIDKSNL
ncbi:MAG: sigma-54-dependent Fis family transcriptional regulator, partial [Rhizobacter sp.]|nr:sigma-54-dependent Fis family transcriptional regulator [Ferruginibacter sp.]